jgi:hypothetical protein
MAKFKITQTTSVTSTTYVQPTVDKYVSPTNVDGTHFGGTGGLTSQAGYQIQPQVKVGSNSVAAGSILSQKGSKKFRVQDASGNKGDCSLVNLATPTAVNTMSLQVNTALLGSANVAVQGSAATYTYVTWATANVAGPVAPATGQILTGTGITGTVTIQTLSTAGGLANANVSFSSQTVSSQNYTNLNISVYASRITNKYVWDYGNNGEPSSSIAGGYNHNKYRYRLSTPDSTFVQVASA